MNDDINQQYPNDVNQDGKKDNLFVVLTGILGVIFFGFGIILTFLNKEDIKNNVATDNIFGKEFWGHLLQILGESLAVFALVNGFLEVKYKERFEEKMFKTFRETFQQTSDELVNEIHNFSERVKNGIFISFLQEKTSPEIASEIKEGKFFNSDFLKTKSESKYKFTIDPTDSNFMILIQNDEFCIKNISGIEKKYNIPLILTSTTSKSYEFEYIGFSIDKGSTYKKIEINAENFDINPSRTVSNGLSYKSKENTQITILPNNDLMIRRRIKARLLINPDGVDDYFFTTHYMMPSILSIIVPEDYEFNLYPTFDEDKLIKKPEYNVDYTMSYQLPFLYPFQGYNFLVKKKN